MPNTYSQLYIQIVFAVKGRQNFIKEEFREELQKYITGIIQNKKQKLFAIYCMPDHVHIFISISPNITISDLVKEIKTNSNSFLKLKEYVSTNFQWQEGYGAFSYSHSSIDRVVKYIINQPINHKQKSFKEEYYEFLEKYNVKFEEKYLFEFY